MLLLYYNITRMLLSSLKLANALFIFCVAEMGGAWPLLKKIQMRSIQLSFGEAFAYGVFLGAGFLHLLPDAIHGLQQAAFPGFYAVFLVLISFLALWLLETLQNNLTTLTLLGALLLSIHSLLEGAAVGVTSQLSATLLLLLAIIAHKGSAGFALATQLNRSHLCRRHRFFVLSAFALMTPIGILLGNQVLKLTNPNPIIEPILNALAAGTFIYLGSMHLPKEFCQKNVVALGLGFSLMGLVAIF